MATELVFTTEEIVVLLAALDAWEKEATSGAMLSSMMGMVLIKDESEAKGYMDERMNESEKEADRRRDDAIMLRAKLVMMKRELIAVQLFNGTADVRA